MKQGDTMEWSANGYRVLIADDDVNVHQSLNAYFRKEGFQPALSAYDGEEAVRLTRSASPNMVLMDIMMPRMDGLMACREIRKESGVPIIMLTAKGEEIDKLLGLELGADDYITKPFSPREVVARIKAVLRRIHESRETPKENQLTIGNLSINLGSFIVKLGDDIIPCTPKEIEILWALASSPGMVFSREHLLQSIWGYEYLGDTRAVDSHIKRIRAKLCREGNAFDIKTVWGVGYRFEISGG